MAASNEKILVQRPYKLTIILDKQEPCLQFWCYLYFYTKKQATEKGQRKLEVVQITFICSYSRMCKKFCKT